MKGNGFLRGAVLALFAAACWGIISPVAKVLAGAGIDLMSVMVFRALFSLTAVGAVLFLTRGSSAFRAEREEMRFYFISGALSVAIAGGSFLSSLEYLTVAEALVIHYTFPLVAIAGSLCVTRERPTLLQIAAGIIIVVGVFVGMGGDMASMRTMSVPGVLWGLGAVFGMAGQALMTRRWSLGHKMDEMKLLFWSNCFGAVLLFVFKSLRYGWGDLPNFTLPLFSLMTLQAFCGSVLAYGAFFASLKYIPAAVTSLLCTFEIVVAVGLTAIFVGQAPSMHEVAGCALILTAIACSSIKKKTGE